MNIDSKITLSAGALMAWIASGFLLGAFFARTMTKLEAIENRSAFSDSTGEFQWIGKK